MSVLLYIASIFVLILTWVYFDFKKRYKFWALYDVPHMEPTFPVGNVADTLKTTLHFSHIMEKIYHKLKHHGDYAGIYFFREPVLVVLSPEFAKIVLVRDFQYFVDRGVYSNEEADPLSANLFFLEGSRWKNLRAKLTPAFTSGKLKMMFHTILAVGEEFDKYLDEYVSKNEDIEVKDVLARFMTDIVGSCAFGIDCNSLQNPNSTFRVMGRKMINFPKLKALKIFFSMMFRNKARMLGIRFNDEDVSEFFMKVVRDTIEYREKNNTKRKDFMQLLINLKNKGTLDEGDTEVEENKLTFEEISAQAFVFFFAGFETSATTMTYALHLLSINQDIQDEGRASINKVLKRYDGQMTYEAVMEMTYLDNIINETLRMYPPVATLHRITTKPYKLPNGSTIPEGIGVVIPNLAFQRDPELFPEPMKFNPDRFGEGSKSHHNFSSLPFGEGPRICIGMRFGLLQTRMGLAMLLRRFKFSVCSKTDVPLNIDTVNLIHAPAGDVWLHIEKISGN